MDINLKHLKKNLLLIVYFIFILFVRLFLLSDVRIYAISDANYDDGLMINMAQSLTQFRWLGNYNNLTLSKGSIFPFYLAFLHEFSIPFLLANSIFCFVAALVLVYVLNSIIHNRYALAVIYTVLMFNPTTYAVKTFQRVYRDSIYQYLVILLFTGIMAIYLNRKCSVKRLLFWSILSGIFLSLTWFIREDSIWTVPFVLTGIIITICFVIFDKKIDKKKQRCGIIAVPALILLLSGISISTINYAAYGTFLTNDYISGNFTKANKALCLVKPVGTWNATVPINKATREEIYKVIPAFAKIKPYLESHPMVAYTNGNPDGGHFPWALRDAVEEAGYNTAKSQQAYYDELANEINSAFKKGLLKKRSGYIFTFVSPWDSRYSPLLKTAFESGLSSVVNFSFANSDYDSTLSSGNNTGIRSFEYYTDNLAYYSNEQMSKTLKNKIITKIQHVYANYNKYFLALGLLCYLYMTVMLVLSIKSKKFKYFDVWIILTGLAISFLIRLLITSYTTVSSFIANNEMYLASSYMIMLVFIFVSIFAITDHILSFRTNAANKHPVVRTNC